MQSDFSEIPLFTGYLSFLNNITAFIRQTELPNARYLGESAAPGRAVQSSG